MMGTFFWGIYYKRQCKISNWFPLWLAVSHNTLDCFKLSVYPNEAIPPCLCSCRTNLFNQWWTELDWGADLYWKTNICKQNQFSSPICCVQRESTVLGWKKLAELRQGDLLLQVVSVLPDLMVIFLLLYPRKLN